METRKKLSEAKKGKRFVFRPDHPCPYCKSVHIVSASKFWRCFDCKHSWIKIRKVCKPWNKDKKFAIRKDNPCPKCGSVFVYSLGKNWKCGDCGRYWVKVEKQKIIQVTREKLEELKKLSQSKIAKKLNCSQSEVCLLMKKYGVETRPKHVVLRQDYDTENKRKGYEKVSKALKGNTNWRFSHKFPNSEEKKLIGFFNKWNLPFKYVGDGSFKIDGKCPDFIWKEKKLIIEFFGELWHKESDEPKRIDFFKQYEWKCLVIWGKELWTAKGKNRNYPKEQQLYDKIIRWLADLPKSIYS